MAVTGSLWLLQDLCGCDRIYMAVTGSIWLLQDLRIAAYRIYVTSITMIYMAVTGPYNGYIQDPVLWLLQDRYGCYRIHMAVTGSNGCYRIYMAC